MGQAFENIAPNEANILDRKATMNKFQLAQDIAFFLLERTGSVCGQWKGKLTAKEQRELFCVFFGKGTLYIDGTKETVEHVVTVGFGQDYDITNSGKWWEAVEKQLTRNANKPTKR